jgi:peptidyl-dipeptidase A
MRRHRLAVLAAALVFAAVVPARSPAAGPTPDEAKAFIEQAESRLLSLWIDAERASWVYSTFITDDTALIQAQARQKVIDETVRLSKEAQRFKGLKLDTDVARKFALLPISLSLVAPSDPAKSKELSEIAAAMEGIYAKGKYCPPGKECMDIGAISERLTKSHDPKELTELWEGWHAVAKPSARITAFCPWRTGRGDPSRSPASLAYTCLWPGAKGGVQLYNQSEPLYGRFTVRAAAATRTARNSSRGKANPPPAACGPAVGGIYPSVAPPTRKLGYDLTKLLEAKQVDAKKLVGYGEGFFKSLGFAPLPATFWERSQFVKPKDRDVVCHASAWDIDWKDDLRLKMCIKVNDNDFVTVHHELGHNFYQRAYNKQSPLFAQGANDGFHEGIGDAIALSATPAYP